MDVEIASSTNDENVLLSDRDFEDISSKVENRFSKRLRDTEVNQREILKLIENLSSKVDNLANVNPGQNSLTFETGISEIPNDELEEVEPARSVNSNITLVIPHPGGVHLALIQGPTTTAKRFVSSGPMSFS